MNDEGDPGECPKCGGYALYYRCHEIGCDDGVIDVYDDDPINNDPGDTETCETCQGKGAWWVCESGCVKNDERTSV